MKIALVTPAAPRSRSGNRNTAQRWANFFKQMGHRVTIQTVWDGAAADVMLALHARRSHDSIRRFATTFPQRPLIVALTGTDLYRDIRIDASAQESLSLATRMVVLQDMGLQELSADLQAKTRVIYQSTPAIAKQTLYKTRFEVCVIGHLREEKDPFRTALALPHLPQDSRVHISHMGRAMSEAMASVAEGFMRADSRYQWLGEIPHWQVRKKLARSHVMVISSKMEGGANVVTEAIAAGTPVIASRIAGNIGMLGLDYAGYYALEDERALARLLTRAETEPNFYALLKKQCAARRKLVTPKNELSGLRKLLLD